MSNGDLNIVLFVGMLVFVGIWGYAFYRWKFLKGLSIGWVPAIIGAGIAMVVVGLLLPH